jgi:hypothetical protein
MLLIGLLLIALVCLALGLVLASAAWLIGSLAASAAAAYALWRMRSVLSADSAGAGNRDDDGDDDVATWAAALAVPERPGEAPRRVDDRDVWVVDGRPDYHAAGCVEVAGADAEVIALSQATEDGFAPCPACDPLAPRAVTAAATTPTVPVPAPDRDVWVIDGRPNYHVAGCVEVAGADAEVIALSQATEDGFAPCPACDPDRFELPPSGLAQPELSGPESPEPELSEPEPLQPEPLQAEPPVATDSAARSAPDATADTVVFAAVTEPVGQPSPASDDVVESPTVQAPAVPIVPTEQVPGQVPGQVWVIDGRPRYHLADCMIIKGQGAEPIPFEQATEDGFIPCSLCEPNAVRT